MSSQLKTETYQTYYETIFAANRKIAQISLDQAVTKEKFITTPLVQSQIIGTISAWVFGFEWVFQAVQKLSSFTERTCGIPLGLKIRLPEPAYGKINWDTLKGLGKNKHFAEQLTVIENELKINAYPTLRSEGTFTKEKANTFLSPLTFIFIPINYLARNIGKALGWLVTSLFTIPASFVINIHYSIKSHRAKMKRDSSLKRLNPPDQKTRRLEFAKAWLDNPAGMPASLVAQYISAEEMLSALKAIEPNKISTCHTKFYVTHYRLSSREESEEDSVSTRLADFKMARIAYLKQVRDSKWSFTDAYEQAQAAYEEERGLLNQRTSTSLIKTATQLVNEAQQLKQAEQQKQQELKDTQEKTASRKEKKWEKFKELVSHQAEILALLKEQKTQQENHLDKLGDIETAQKDSNEKLDTLAETLEAIQAHTANVSSSMDGLVYKNEHDHDDSEEDDSDEQEENDFEVQEEFEEESEKSDEGNEEKAPTSGATVSTSTPLSAVAASSVPATLFSSAPTSGLSAAPATSAAGAGKSAANDGAALSGSTPASTASVVPKSN